MRFRKLERRFSISAPRLSVRPHVPWYIRWAIAIPIILALGGVVWWAYDSGLELAGFHRGQAVKELEGLRETLSQLQDENAKLSSKAASFERQAQMENAATLDAALADNGTIDTAIKAVTFVDTAVPATLKKAALQTKRGEVIAARGGDVD